MALLSRVKNPEWQDGDILTSADLIAEFNNIINGLNGSADISVLDITCDDVTGDVVTCNSLVTSAVTLSNVNVVAALTPIGSIIPFYEFAANVLTFNANNWVYCDGGTATVGGVSRTLPDLSNRYLVGFGTEGGGDIDTASFSATPVGAASHQINVLHTHTLSGSTASGTTGITATHNHIHSVANTYAQLTVSGGAGDDIAVRVASPVTSWTASLGYALNRGTDSASYTDAISCAGNTDTPNTSTVSVTDGGHTHSVGTLEAANALSATQSIQPRSLGVRFIMRKA